jgi:predicted house-cleaning noncanonical NTP pyrophosphatase (MazG superfamily)
VIVRRVQWVEPLGTTWIENDDPLPAGFGGKASGLIYLPHAWVPAFFVLSPEFHRILVTLAADETERELSELTQLVRDCSADSDIDATQGLILRSNAANEDLLERGKYTSIVIARLDDLQNGLRQFYEAASRVSRSSYVGCIVQDYARPIFRGNLSNERRVSREYRDASIESEDMETRQIKETRLSYRRWRGKADMPQDDAIVCRNRNELHASLRQALIYAAERRIRINFEWVWDGAYIYIVQADKESERIDGESPDAVVDALPTHKETDFSDLKCFKAANLLAGGAPTKLNNHRLYVSLGAWQPRFYQLEDPRIMEQILQGIITDDLREDLNRLTGSPLVIRTCKKSGSAPLLPRSGLLTSGEASERWLIQDFRNEIQFRGLQATDISLLCHHFIPATTAAYALARPDNSTVYIESLWGVPEGLYYFPFDSYRVVARPHPLSLPKLAKDLRSLVTRSRVIHKPYFVAPTETGAFDRYPSRAPFDWKASIEDPATLADIASFTLAVAQKEQRAVNMMWFVNCRIGEGRANAIPWFHEEFEERDIHEVLSRTGRDRQITIATEADLVGLEQLASQPDFDAAAARILVRLSPRDDQAIRNEQFASRVGAATKAVNGVVVLEGGTLSHVYYTLTRSGATVVGASDSSARPLREAHEKLVRDKIPKVVTEGGESARIARLNPDEHLAALKIKLVEEAFEVRDSRREGLIEELADVSEVISAICATAGISSDELARVQERKRDRRGGFDEGLLLLETGRDDPLVAQNDAETGEDNARGPRIVESDNAPKLESARPGAADRHSGPGFVEFVQSASVSLSFPHWRIDSPRTFRVSSATADSLVTWAIEAQRRGVELQLRIKVRIGDGQLELPLTTPPK